MNFSNAEDECEAELHVVEQQQEVKCCYTCKITERVRPTCPFRKQRPPPMKRNHGLN